MKRKQNSMNYIIIAIAVIFVLIIHNVSLSSQIDGLQQNVNDLQYKIKDVSQQLDTIIELNSMISDSQYEIEQIEEKGKTSAKVNVELISNKLEQYTDLQLLYRKTYDYTESESYDYSNEEWKYTELNNNHGSYSSNFIVPFTCNYELKIAFKDNNKTSYELLPDLDLYTKSENVFKKNINIHSVKKSKLEFDVQIVKLNSSGDPKLVNAICNVFYGDDVVKVIDILKENEISGRKEPRNQLEHSGGDYWFVIEDVDFSRVEEFDESKVKVEVILEDSLGNIYKKIEKSADVG